MAKGDLYRLAVEAKEFLSKEVEEYRAKYLNKQAHSISMDLAGLRQSIKAELRANGLDDSINFDAEIKEYIKAVAAKLDGKQADVDFKVRTAATLVAVITPRIEGYDVFNAINAAKADAQAVLVSKINKKLNSSLKAAKFLDTGHTFAAALDMAAKSITPIVNLAASDSEAKKLSSKLISIINDLDTNKKITKLNIASKQLGDRKSYIVSVVEEGHRSENTNVASKERALKNRVKRSIERWIHNHDWLNQKSSSSYYEFIEGTLVNSALNSSKHAKGKRVKLDTKPNNASVVLAKSKKKTINHNGNSVSIKPQLRKSPINLVNILNRKLPDEIRKRMTYPRLQYRTGRFAQSVRAVSAEQTDKGGVSVSYTYQRNPYQIFERGLGAPPWNTPERDPRDLIDASIRSIARELITARIYTRRI